MCLGCWGNTEMRQDFLKEQMLSRVSSLFLTPCSGAPPLGELCLCPPPLGLTAPTLLLEVIHYPPPGWGTRLQVPLRTESAWPLTVSAGTGGAESPGEKHFIKRLQ